MVSRASEGKSPAFARREALAGLVLTAGVLTGAQDAVAGKVSIHVFVPKIMCFI